MAEIDGDKAQDKGQGGRDLEVDEALDAHASDALEVAVAGDAGDQRREDERSDDGFDQAKKDVAENTQVDGYCGCIEAQLGTGDHRDEDPHREGPAAPSIDPEKPDRGPAQTGRNAVQRRLVDHT